MKKIPVIIFLFIGIACTKGHYDQPEVPEGELLDKTVTRYMPGTSSDKYVTKRYVYEQNRLVKTITDRDGTPYSELKFSYDNLGKLSTPATAQVNGIDVFPMKNNSGRH